MLLVVSFLVTPLINPSSVSFILKFTYSLFTHNFRTIVKKWTYVKKGHSFDQDIVEELHSVLDELRTQLESRHGEVAQVAREWWCNGRIIYMEWAKVKKKDWSCKKNRLHKDERYQSMDDVLGDKFFAIQNFSSSCKKSSAKDLFIKIIVKG